mgnify:CR=1 FL=1
MLGPVNLHHHRHITADSVALFNTRLQHHPPSGDVAGAAAELDDLDKTSKDHTRPLDSGGCCRASEVLMGAGQATVSDESDMSDCLRDSTTADRPLRNERRVPTPNQLTIRIYTVIYSTFSLLQRQFVNGSRVYVRLKTSGKFRHEKPKSKCGAWQRRTNSHTRYTVTEICIISLNKSALNSIRHYNEP